MTGSHATPVSHHWLGGIVLAMIVALTGGCSGEQEPATERGPQQKILHYGNGSDPKTLDPPLQSLVLEGNIMLELFEGLVTLDAEGETTPGLAERWEVSADGLRYTFYLREGLQWSDGVPLTAEDFVYSWRRVLDPGTGAELAYTMYAIKNGESINTGRQTVESLGVTAIDEHTLQLELENPQPAIIALLATARSLPVPRHVVEKHGRDWSKPGNMISNGPYLLVDWQVGDRIEIEKNPLYYNADTVHIDRVFFYPTEDAEAALRRLRAGELHIDRNFPMARADWLKENMPDYLHTYPYLGSYFYLFNVQRPPLDDERVRQALSMVVDRDIITRVILHDLGFVPAYTLVPPTIRNWSIPTTPDWAAWPTTQRIEAARKLLAEAGYGPDKTLEINISYNTDESHKRIAVAISKMWEPLGVAATLENFEFRVHTDNVNQGNFDVARRGWIGLQDMPEFFLSMFESSTIPLNAGRWNQPEFDTKLADAMILVDPLARNAVMQEADSILRDELPLLPIYFYISRNLVSPDVSGWVDNAADSHRIRLMNLAGD